MVYLKINQMKKVLFFVAFIGALATAPPAFFQSRFQTMMNEIAGLETYLKSMKTVYSTTSNGLNDIHDIKNGSFNLNQTYFTSLKNVSPAVKNDPHIQQISTLSGQIESTFNAAISWQQSKGLLTTDEISYMRSVYNNLLGECNKDLQELNIVLTNGSVQMTDKQRIDKIDGIYSDMLGKYGFSQSFTNNARQLAIARADHNYSGQTLKTWYQIN
jgi:hypothetical protein